jgi:hypothetical protein
MSLTSRLAAGLLVAGLALALPSCSTGPQPAPATGVDTTTPVHDLAGYAGLIGQLGTTPPGFDSFVETFRLALDTVRRADDPAARASGEAQQWSYAETRTLPPMVGEANVPIVIAWLESVFGRRTPEGATT